MPTWKHNPPCKAQRILSEMFEKGKINEQTSANEAYEFDPEFKKFTLAVFRNNFKQLEKLKGFARNFYKSLRL